MREIIFKAKSQNNNWVEGDLIHGVGIKKGNVYILPRVQNLAYVPDCDPLDGVKVIPETVCQFTGETDKHGTKIFEGDHDKDGNVVTWCEKRNGWSFSISHNYNEIIACHCYECEGNYDFNEYIEDFEPTGNIHDKTDSNG